MGQHEEMPLLLLLLLLLVLLVLALIGSLLLLLLLLAVDERELQILTTDDEMQRQLHEFHARGAHGCWRSACCSGFAASPSLARERCCCRCWCCFPYQCLAARQPTTEAPEPARHAAFHPLQELRSEATP